MPATAHQGAHLKKSPPPGNVGALVAALTAKVTRRPVLAAARSLCEVAGHLHPAQLTNFLLASLVDRWKKIHRPNTARTYRAELKQILHALEPFGAPSITLPKTPWRQRTVTATGDELHRILRDPPAWMRLYLLLYFQCGLRHAETLRVTPRAWNPAQHTITVTIKGGRQRTVALTPDVEALLTAAGEPDPDTSFIAALRGHHMSDSGLRNAWTRHRARCGINPQVTAHDLRRTAATIVYTATKDLRTAQELLGHTNLSSTLSYLAPLHPDDARKYAELLRFEHFKSEVKQ
jgi:integrase